MLRRLLQLFIGLTLYGVSTAMFVRADLGADPWNVFHLGVANLLSMNIGVVIIAVGVLVLLAWIPLRQRPGFGTLSNVIMIGLAADAALLVIPGIPAGAQWAAGVSGNIECVSNQPVHWRRFWRRSA